MTCSVCGATGDPARSHCAVCGHAYGPDTQPQWDRAPEARAFVELQRALKPDETLLAATRGRITGNWHERLSLGPTGLGAPYANLGLSETRLLIQQIGARRGDASAKEPVSFPLDQIRKMAAQGSDTLEPLGAVRLVVTLQSGASLRLRAAGRLARHAQDLAEVFDALTASSRIPHQEAPPVLCEHCGKRLDGQYAFCPFCGKPPTGDVCE